MAPEHARRAARLELGGAESIKEQIRDVRAGSFLDTLLQDVRYGSRLLRRNPLFALTAALSLAIGIGATTTIFTVANDLLLRTSDGVADPGRLVDVVRQQRGDTGVDEISYPDYLELRRRTTTLSDVFAYKLQLDSVSLRITADGAERVFATVATTNYFQLLGVRAAAGRLFGPGDSDRPGASPIAVLSHRFWMRRFGGDSSIPGRTVRLNGHPFAIVGVADQAFRGTSVVAPDLWIPAGMVGVVQPESEAPRLTSRESDWLMLGGRLKPGVSRAQASAEVAALGEALAREFPVRPYLAPPELANLTYDWSAEPASPVPAGLRLIAAALLALLLAIVSVVLLIACANVAGVLLARATARRREMAVRTAIGAPRGRIVRQLLTETVLLMVLGGGAGLALARLLTSAVLVLLPAFPVPVNVSMPLDGRVVAFSLGLSFLAAVLAGLAPALHASKTDVVSALKDDAHAPLDRLRLRNAFVVAQVAGSTLLVVMAATFLRGLDGVVSIDRGFDAKGVDIAAVDLSMAGYSEGSGRQFARDLIERVRSHPGVAQATLANRTPGAGTMSFGGIEVPGAVPPNGAPFFYWNWTFVDPEYFATLRIPLVAGRDFSADDRDGTERVAIVGEGAARRFWPDRAAVGQVLRVHTTHPSAPDAVPPTTLRIVGVARDLAAPGNGRREPALALYVPLRQRYLPQFIVLARSADGRSLVPGLRALVASMDPNLAILSAQTLESEQTGPVEARLRITAAVTGSVGVVGLILAAIGIYGVTAYAVARRTREIGVRLSLGAKRTEVVGLVLRQGMRLVAIGSAAGLALGTAVGRLLAASPMAIRPPDAALLAGVVVLLAVVGLAACAVPVIRATRIRAMEALRYE
jgi:predicted permease